MWTTTVKPKPCVSEHNSTTSKTEQKENAPTQFSKMFPSDKVAINIMHEKTIPYSWGR